MSKIKPWKLISKKDVSVGKWFPLEERTYELPDEKIVDDFTVTTLADVSLIIPFMKDGTIGMCYQYKPGAEELTYEFPGGRRENNHKNFIDTAHHELKEEMGIDAQDFHFIGETITFPTKASERVNNYYIIDGEVNSEQNFDDNEDIEVVFFTPDEIDQMIIDGRINTSPSMAAWLQLKLKYPELLK
ncbi:MAG: NUDIX hydrolase [Candidatus Pacebacteria bacterium]|nr:NUDIX hydrolase [Candidatus Paceibacterota bacterium]